LPHLQHQSQTEVLLCLSPAPASTSAPAHLCAPLHLPLAGGKQQTPPIRCWDPTSGSADSNREVKHQVARDKWWSRATNMGRFCCCAHCAATPSRSGGTGWQDRKQHPKLPSPMNPKYFLVQRLCLGEHFQPNNKNQSPYEKARSRNRTRVNKLWPYF